MIKPIVIVGLLIGQCAPALAADLGPDPSIAGQRSTGAFAGARLRLPLGPKQQASAGLSVAPVQYSMSGTGGIGTRFGEGLSFQSLNGRAPTLNVAGRPLKPVLHAAQDDKAKDDDDDDDGISTVGWVGIGVAVGVVGAIAGFAILLSSIEGE